MVSSKRFSLAFNFIQLFVSITTLLSFSNAKHEHARSAEDRRFASFVDIGSTIYYQSLCLISDKTQIKMQCPSNDKIKILRTIYAYNPVYVKKSTANIDSCTFSVKDCNFDKEYTIDNECTGKNTCLTTIDKARLVNESSSVGQRCNDFNYVQINYQCLPHLPTKNICGYSKSELSHAYITTPNFPDKLEANSNCECTLTSNYENGQILLRRVDMKLPNDRDNQACGETYLEVNENNKGTERKCGYVREPGSIFGSGAGQLKLNFVTGNDDHLYDYGFWLEILASPPKENHLIEIVCNKGAAPTATELGLESTEIIKKLKLIHDKIKRLNQTYMDTKIGSKLSNKTQQFIAKNNKKFLNMTSNIGIFSKKLNIQNNKNNNNKQNSLDNTDITVSQNDLEREIEHFFSSQNLMSKQLDDLVKIDQKLTDPKFKQDSNKKIDFLSLTKNKKNFPIPPLQGKFKNNGKNKQSRPHFNKNEKSKKQQKLEQEENEEKEQEETVSGDEDYEESKKSEKTESEIEHENEQEQETENSLVKELDSLSEELEIGEKLLSSSEGGQIALNKSTISETLAELITDNTLSQQGQPSLMANEKSGTSVLNANAQRQNIGQPEGRSQSSSTDLRMPLIGYRRIISKNNHNHKNKNKYGYRKFRTPFQRQHTIYKRNTITYTDNNTLVNSVNPNSLYTSTEVLTTKQQEQQQSTDVLTTASDIIPDGLNTHEGPAQWLQPFQFEFDESNEFFLNDDYSNSTLFPYLDEEELKIRSTNHPKKSKNPNRKTVRVKLNKTYKTNPTFTTLTTPTTTNPQELFSNSSFERLVSDDFDLNLNNSKVSEENLNKTFINEMINLKNCEKNLTKLTVFYSNTDKLNCYETTQNQSYLKCIDDLLETKLLHKIGLFYYVQLQPLFISKSKMNCYDSNNTYLNWTLPTSKSMTTTQQKTTTSSISSSSLSSSEYDYDDETSSSAEQLTSFTTKKFEPTHFYLNENEFYINDLNFRETFSCSFITKKATNRKKLIWKLYLILKNQTCVQMEELSKSYMKLIEFRKKLESSKNLTQTQDILNTTINKIEIVPKMNAITKSFTSTISTFTATTKPKNANQTFLSFVSNKIILIVLITSSICFILLANLILYIILRTRRKSSSQSNFSMSMNNRLLQNYLDLSVNSENSKNDLDDSKKKTKLKNSSNLLNSETATIVDDYVYSERHFNEIEYQYQTNQKNVIDSIELNNFDNSLQAKESQKPKLINQSQQSNENNYPLSTFNKFNSISGLITGMDSRTNIPQAERACDNKLAQEIHYNNNPLRANGFDDNYTNSTYEISRIPSLKKPIYSVSTIATQADMDRGTFLAERKDFKYRNQDMSDVESQILSIELDCYASLVDWKNSKLNNAQTNEKSAKKELASVTVNDYVAFKNCLNFQLQAAKAMATSNQIVESSSENIPLAVTEFNSESQPFKNRMIVRISSLSSNRSSFQANDKNKPTSPDCVTTTTTTTTTSSCLNEPKEDKNVQLTQESKNLEAELPKMIFDAYQAALAASYSSNTKPEDFLKSFQNNLYMHLDTIPNFKSIQGSLMNSKEFVENFLKVNLQKSDLNDKKESHNLATQTQNPLKQSSTLNTILDESSKSNKLDETCMNSSIKNKEIKDPNMIYSQVESSSSDNDNDNETESSSNTDSSDMSSSSDVNKNEKSNQKKPVLSSSSSDSQKEMACYNLETSQASENISKQEKFKRMLDQEKLILEKAKKPVSLTDDSKFRSTIVYDDDDYSAEEYNYVNNIKDILNDDYSSSNEASSKNVRFADDVSYI